MRSCPQGSKGAYVYASLPVVRGGKGAYRTEVRPPITLLEADQDKPPKLQPPSTPNDFYQRCLELQNSVAKKSSSNVRKFRHDVVDTGSSLESHIGPASVAFGRSSISVQTGLYLEELTETVETDDFGTQTDQFLDRPPSPIFIPAKTGIDVATQIEPYDLFDFNIEVRPILEVLVGKTTEQALLEVMEEEELSELRRQQAVFQEIHNADLAEIARLEERNRRYREEQAHRRAQAEHAAILRQQTAEKITARGFVKAYLEPLLPSTYQLLLERGYLYDSVQHEIEEHFYVPLIEKALDEHLRERRARILIDGIINEAVTERHFNFISLGWDQKALDMIEFVMPKMQTYINQWLFERMTSLAFARLVLADDATKNMRSSFVDLAYNECIDDMALEVIAQKEAEAAAANEAGNADEL